MKDTPVAGIWRERFFAPSLLWRVSDKKSDEGIRPFRCPSWSWGSVSRPVVYTGRVPSRPNKNKPWKSYDDTKYFPNIIRWNIDDNGRDGVDGYVSLRCKLLREDEMDCEKHFVKDFLNAPPKPHGDAEAIHFETHHDFADAAMVEGTWLMPVRTKQYILGGKDKGRYTYDIETQLLRLEKISPDRADFRRIGLVITRSWANKWLEKGQEEVFRVF